MTRLLLTGAAGLLGRAVAAEAGDRELVQVVHSTPAPGDGQVRMADLSVPGQARRVLDLDRPDLVVNCAALVRPEDCERDPALAQALNTDLPAELAGWCAERGAQLVHISTDAVYGEQPGPFRESTPARPNTSYSRTKSVGEQAVLAALPTALVARVNFFGADGGLARFFLNALRGQGPVPGFHDIVFTPMYSRDLARLLFSSLDHGVHGVRNFGGSQELSKYEFGRAVADAYGFDPDRVVPTSRHDGGLTVARVSSLSMDSTVLAEELDEVLPSADDGIRRMRQDGHLPSEEEQQ